MDPTLKAWQQRVQEAARNMENDMSEELIPHLKERIATMQEALGKSVARELELEAELDELTDRNRQMETALVDLSDKLMRAHRVEMERAEYRIEQYLADLVRRIPR